MGEAGLDCVHPKSKNRAFKYLADEKIAADCFYLSSLSPSLRILLPLVEYTQLSLRSELSLHFVDADSVNEDLRSERLPLGKEGMLHECLVSLTHLTLPDLQVSKLVGP